MTINQLSAEEIRSLYGALSPIKERISRLQAMRHAFA